MCHIVIWIKFQYSTVEWKKKRFERHQWISNWNHIKRACHDIHMNLHVDTVKRVYTQFHVNQTKGWVCQAENKMEKKKKLEKMASKIYYEFPESIFSCWIFVSVFFSIGHKRVRGEGIISFSFEYLIQYSEYFWNWSGWI